MINSNLSIKEAKNNNKELISSKLDDFKLEDTKSIQRAIMTLPLRSNDKTALQDKLDEFIEREEMILEDREKAYDKAVAKRKNASAMREELARLRSNEVSRKNISVTQLKGLPRKKKKAAKKRLPEENRKRKEVIADADANIEEINQFDQAYRREYEEANNELIEDEEFQSEIDSEYEDEYDKYAKMYDDKMTS